MEPTKSWALPPGPPGFTKRVSSEFPFSAGRIRIARVIARPSGSFQSSGTMTLAHR